MQVLKLKIKITVLWIIFAISASAAMIIWFVEPGILEQIMTKGEMVTEKLNESTKVFFAFYWLIPLSMAFLTQVLKPILNRWLNVVISLLFGIMTIFYFFSHLIQGWFTIPNLMILMFSLIATILIVVHASKLPKEME